MNDPVVLIENLSKAYQLGNFGSGTLSSDLSRWWALMRGKEDPLLKVGETNDRTLKGSSDVVWSLKDINFDIRRGDAVGIIGRNGAGKSTLLKILSRVTAPSEGSVKIRGRVASLLEVGTGFHPELTGRENIFLNGAILGMTKAEIKTHFDAIVDFSGIERYIDTPVKRYSSGMYVRLAFAVAAHLESEILIIDEVLAVGDAEFQKKCLGKMKDVSQGEGRTVLFVSHNISAISALTNRCVFLQNGRLVQSGDTNSVIQLYQTSSISGRGSLLSYYKAENDFRESKPIELISAEVLEQDDVICVDINYLVRRNIGSVVAIRINNLKGVALITLRDTDRDPGLFAKKPGKYHVRFMVPVRILAADIFNVTLSFADMKSERFDFFEDLLSFEIQEPPVNASEYSASREGILLASASYVTKTQNL